MGMCLEVRSALEADDDRLSCMKGCPMNLIFLGAPGSGKGTQAAALVQHFGIAHISTGDMLRAAVAAQTPMGKAADAYMSAGKLVPDEVVIGIVEDRLREADCAKGFLLDGFPRTSPQAKALDEMLERMGRGLDKVVYLEVDSEELFKRLLARGRADDSAETVRARLQVYQDQTAPLIAYYDQKGLLVRIQGKGDVAEITRRILDGVK